MWKLLVFFCIGQCLCLYKGNDMILKFNGDNYEDFIATESKPIIFHAYSPLSQQCKDVAHKFMKIAEELKEIIRFGCIQVDREKNLAHELGIRKPNTFYIVKNGEVEQFTGPITSKNMVSMAMNQVLANLDATPDGKLPFHSKNLVQLNDDNFDDVISKSDKPWMVLFYSPLNRGAKNMIPLWYGASESLKDSVKFGVVDTSRNAALANEYDVAGHPTGILLFHEATFYLHYNDHLTADFIIEWITNKMEDYNEDTAVTQLISAYQYEKCIDKPLCVIIFLPHIFDCQTKCRNNLLRIMMEVYEAYNTYYWGWLWCEVGTQLDLQRAVGVDNFQIPTAVAISGKKNKVTNLSGSYSSADLDAFLQNVLLTKVPSNDMKKYVRIHETEPWDGKDAIGKKNNLDFFDVNVRLKDEL